MQSAAPTMSPFDIDNWPYLAAWAGRLKAMPGFALPYELIPSKDHELDPA